MSNELPERLKRPRVEALDEMLGVPLKVLDDGFVRVIDYLGSDASVVQAARVSYGVGTKQVHEDRGLLRYLMRHRHTTPFEMCEIKLHVRVPMDCWRQWIRHRTANVNEYSTRYSSAVDSAQRTKATDWRAQITGNKQGSDDVLSIENGEQLTIEEGALQAQARQVYERRLALGVAREQARKDLPLSTYTEAYWKIDLHNLLHFLSLRMDSHSQLEIRSYATVIGQGIVSKWCPLTWEAFVDFRLESLMLSREEIAMIRALSVGQTDEARRLAIEMGFLSTLVGGKPSRLREQKEFRQKLGQLGLSDAWLA